MLAIEARQDHHEKELAVSREKNMVELQRIDDRNDARYRVIDAKIDSILHHLMARTNNQRDGDKL